MVDGLKSKTLANIGYSSLARLFVLLLQILAGIILARQLSSSDYGIAGFAMIFISFLSQFSELGIVSAAIQKSELKDEGLYTGFAMKVALGAGVFVISFLAAPLVRLFFDTDAVVSVTRVLSLTFIISMFSFLPTVLLTRDLDYKRLSLAQVVAAVANSGVAIFLALKGFGYWSVIVGSICATTASVVVLNLSRRVKYRFSFNKTLFFGFLRYGGNLFLTGILVFVIFNADNFIIGAKEGAKVLGYYTVAFTWGSMICGILSTSVLNVLFPTFSKIQGDKDTIKWGYLKVVRYISFLAIIWNLALLVVSKDFLFFVLGHGTDKWAQALMPLRILLVYGILRAVLEPVGNVLMAIGRTDVLLKANLLAAIVQLAFLYPALASMGILGVAIVVLVAYLSQYPIYFVYLRSELSVNLQDLWRFVKPAVLSIGAVGVVVPLCDLVLGYTLISMVEKLAIITVVYFLSFGTLTRWEMIREVRSRLLEMGVGV